MAFVEQMSFGLDAVNISFLASDDGVVEKRLPLVVTPRWNSSNTFLTEWCRINRAWMDEMLLKYGAILVRGFEIDNARELEQVIQGYRPDLSDTYRGTSPRKLIQGTKYVFSAAEVPVNFPIAQHIEMSFLPAPPRELVFGCLQAPRSAGGETALADFRQVCLDLPADLRQKFLEKGIRYERTHKKIGSYFTYDVADMLGWPALFGTDDQKEVEQICRDEGMEYRWEGDTFISEFKTEAFQLHPITKEPVWFNHTQVFHWTTFPAELWFAWRRTADWRLLIQCILVTIFCVVKYGILGYKMALYSSFGDGEPISVKEMQQVRNAIHKNMVFSRWRKGDVVFIDNFSTSHGRQPTYDKGRKIVVSWACPLKKSNELTAETVTPATFSGVGSAAMDNPQERTPESTMTRMESSVLKEELLASRLKEAMDKNFPAPHQNITNGTSDAKHRHRKVHSQPASLFQANFWKEE